MKAHLARKRPPLHALALTLALSLGAATLDIPSQAQAGPIDSHITYRTTGTVGDLPGSAWNPVFFRGIENGDLTASQPFTLGEFEVAPSARGSVDVPFVITFGIKSLYGVDPTPNDSPVLLQGRIVGMLGDEGQSILQAIFDQGPQPLDPKYSNPHPAPPFHVGDWIARIHVNGGSEFLTLRTDGSARTTIEARLELLQIPEPTSLAVFSLAALCLVLRRRVRPSSTVNNWNNWWNNWRE